METLMKTMLSAMKQQMAKLAMRYVSAIGVTGTLFLLLGTAATVQAQSSIGKIFYTWADEIYVMNADGTNQTQLTDVPSVGIGYRRWPSANRDGSRVVFNSSSNNNYKIYTVNGDGTGLKRLTNGTSSEEEPAISPDGRKVVFTSEYGNDSIYIMNVDGSGKKSLGAKGRSPVFSPDGRKIAYTVRPVSSGITNIYIMNIDGSGQTRVIGKSGIFGQISFSPDGRRIAFAIPGGADRGIYLVNVDGSNLVRLNNSPVDARDVSFSPDGQRIAFTSQDVVTYFDNIYTMRLDGSDKKVLTRGYSQHRLHWSSGRVAPRTISIENSGITEGDTGTTSLEFRVRLSGTSMQPVTVVYKTLDGTALGKATPGAGSSDYQPANGTLTFAAGETRKTFTIMVNGDTEIEPNEFFRVQLSAPQGASLGASLATGTIVNNDPSVRSTGKIVFDSTRAGNSDIYIMNADGSNQTRLTFSPGIDRSAVLSPDGQTIAFESNRDGGESIYLMGADGSNQRSLIKAQDRIGTPHFSPDGRKIAFAMNSAPTTGDHFDIYVVNVDGSNLVQLTHDSQPNLSPQFSPDGRKIIYYSYPTNQIPGLRIMNSDGSNQVRLTQGTIDTFPTYSPDGSKIAFATQRNDLSQIFTINSDSSNPTLLSNTTVYGYQPNDTTPDYSPDGREIAFAFYQNQQSHIYVMDANGNNRIQLTTAPNNYNPNWGPGSVPAPSPRVFFSNARVPEGNSGSRTMIITASLSQTSRTPVSVNYVTLNDTATSAVDFAVTRGTLTFAPGQTRLSIPITIKSDTLPEGNETFFVQALSARGAIIANRGVGTILNDDQSALSLTLAAPRLTEGANGARGTFTTARLTRNVQLTRDTPELAVNIVVSPTGQTTQPTHITIPARTASVTFNIAAIDDALVEPSRPITITALALGHTRASAMLTVLDNDTTPRPALAASSIVLSSATVADNLVRLTFIGPLATEALDITNFVVTRDGQAISIESLSYSNGTVTITLPISSTKPGDTLLVRYRNLHGADGKVITEGEMKIIAR